MSRAREFLLVLGVAFLVGGIFVATFDRFLAIGCFLIGAFLVILPLTAIHDEED